MGFLARTASLRPKTPKALAERAYESSHEAQGRPGQTRGAVERRKTPTLRDFPPNRLTI